MTKYYSVEIKCIDGAIIGFTTFNEDDVRAELDKALKGLIQEFKVQIK